MATNIIQEELKVNACLECSCLSQVEFQFSINIPYPVSCASTSRSCRSQIWSNFVASSAPISGAHACDVVNNQTLLFPILTSELVLAGDSTKAGDSIGASNANCVGDQFSAACVRRQAAQPHRQSRGRIGTRLSICSWIIMQPGAHRCLAQ